MTVPREELVDETTSNFYHCWSRCVRRAFLCGNDPVSGKSFEHRRGWIENRLAYLVTVFAVDLGAYAIMANHYHAVLRNRPDIAQNWSAEEVARRWLTIFPGKTLCADDAESMETHIQAIVIQAKLVEEYRKRLCSLSWFHRCLNEWIARKANAEDECTGHFWEGRFRSERLNTAAAVVACAVYVDLNPIRAGIAKTPEESEFTSVRRRVTSRKYKGEKSRSHKYQCPSLLAIAELSDSGLSEDEYFTLVDETGRQLRSGKGSIPSHLVPILERLKLKPDSWLTMQTKKRQLFRRTIGPLSSLRKLAESAGKCWFQGLKSAQLIFA